MPRPPGCLRDEAVVFRLRNAAREGATGLLEAGKIPEIREVAALLGLHRLHHAIASAQEDAFSIRFLLQDQPAAVMAEASVLLNEIMLALAFERREPGDFRVRQTHLARPATAGGAALTLVKNRHAGKLHWRPPVAHP